MQATPDEIYAIEYVTCGERTPEARRECAERAKRLHLLKLTRAPIGPTPSQPPPDGEAVAKAELDLLHKLEVRDRAVRVRRPRCFENFQLFVREAMAARVYHQ